MTHGPIWSSWSMSINMLCRCKPLRRTPPMTPPASCSPTPGRYCSPSCGNGACPFSPALSASTGAALSAVSAIDPVVMVKYLLLGFLYGIPSERQIEVRCADSNAFRWYLGIDLDERVPDHSTISQLRRRKPAFRKVFRRLFEEAVRQCVEKDLRERRLSFFTCFVRFARRCPVCRFSSSSPSSS